MSWARKVFKDASDKNLNVVKGCVDWKALGLSLTAGRINRLLGSFEPATFVIYIYIFKDKLFVPLLAQIYENETFFPLQFIDLKIIWLAQRYTIISSLR